MFVLTKINGLSQTRKYPTMWPYGQHYHVERVDVKTQSFDCGIMFDFMFDFKQSSRLSSKYKNIIEGNNMLGKYKKSLRWITALLNVVFLSLDGMKHLRGHEDMIPIVDYFL